MVVPAATRKLIVASAEPGMTLPRKRPFGADQNAQRLFVGGRDGNILHLLRFFILDNPASPCCKGYLLHPPASAESDPGPAALCAPRYPARPARTQPIHVGNQSPRGPECTHPERRPPCLRRPADWRYSDESIPSAAWPPPVIPVGFAAWPVTARKATNRVRARRHSTTTISC